MWKESFKQISKRTLILTLLIFLIALVGFIIFMAEYGKRAVAEQEIITNRELDNYAFDLQNTIDNKINKLNALETYVYHEININGDFQEFEIIAQLIVSDCNCIKNISIAPNGIQQYVYPFEGNENVIGHDLMNDQRDEVRTDVQSAIDSGNIILSGPYQLRQGGYGLVARKAIYHNNEFWGLIALVLDIPKILEDSGIDSSLDSVNHQILDEAGEIVWGLPLEDDYQSIYELKIINEKWSLISSTTLVAPPSVWLTNLFLFILGFLFIILISGFTFLLSNRSDFQKYQIDKIQKELSYIEQLNTISMNSMDSIVFLVDTEFRFIFVNKEFNKWAKFYQTDPDVIGKNLFEVFPNLLDDVYEEYQEVNKRKISLTSTKTAIDNNQMVSRESKKIPIIFKDEYIGILTIINDLTEKVKSMNLKRKHSTIIDSIHDSIISTTPEGVITSWNRGSEIIFGYSAPETIGKPISILLDEEKINLFDPIVKKLNTGEEIPAFEIDLINKSGKKVAVLLSLSAIKNDQGKVIELSGISTDIQEFKATQEALIQTKERFRTLAESSPVGIYYTDIDGNCEYVNPAWLEMAGMEFNEAMGDKWIEAIHPDDRDFVAEKWEESVASADRWEYEYRFLSKDGKTTWVYGTASKLLDQAGNFIGFVGVNTDITERKQAEQDLAAREAFLSAIFNNSLNAMLVADDNGNYVSVNHAAVEMFGYPEEKFLAMNVGDLRTTYPPGAAKRYQEYLEKGQEIGEFDYIHPETGVKHLLYHASRIDDNLNLSVLSDITERKLIDEQLRRTRLLLSEAERISRFGSWEWNSETGELFWSDGLYDIFGRKKEDGPLIFDEILEQIHPEDRDIFQKSLSEAIQTNGRYTENYRIIQFDDNAEIWVYAEGEVFEDENGKRMIGSVQDISERKIAEEALKESENKFRELFNNMPSGVAIYEAVNNGEDFRFIGFNPKAEAIEGINKEEVIGRKVTEVFPGVKEMGALKVFQDVYNSLQKYTYTTGIYVDRNNSQSWRDNWVFRLPDGKIVAIYNDITARHLANKEIQKSAERFSYIFNSVPVSIWEEDYTELLKALNKLNVETSDELRKKLKREPVLVDSLSKLIKVKDVNDHTLDLFKAKDKKMLFGSIDKVLSDSSMDNIIEELCAVFDRKKYFFGEITNVDLNGEEINIFLSISFPDKVEDYSSVLVCMVDITERVEAERKIEESEIRFRSIFENSRDAIAVVHQGKLLYVNQACQTLFGYDQGDIDNLNIIEMFAEGDRDRVQDYIEARNKGKAAPTFYEAIGRRKDGSHFNMESSIASYTVNNELFVVSLIRDITSRKENEKAIRDSEYSLSIINDIQSGILSSQNIEDLSAIITQKLLRYFKCLRAGISLIDHQNKTVKSIAEAKIEGFSPNSSRQIDYKSYTDLFPRLLNERIIVIDDLSNRDKHAKEIDKSGGKIAVFAALVYEENLLGVIGISFKERELFSEFSEEILKQTADQLAIAIHQATLVENIQKSRTRAQMLAQKVVTVQEDERQYISRELHDDTGQNLTALKVQLQLISSDVPEQYSEILSMLNDSSELADSTLEKIRNLARGLRPPVLDTIGLNSALSELCREFSSRVGIDIQYSGEEIKDVEQIKQISIYRILQEALTNITKHSNASKVEVQFKVNPSEMILFIEDNGKGFNTQQIMHSNINQTGLGLRNMQERVELIGGKFEILSEIGKGTTLKAFIPNEGKFIEKRENRK